MTSEPDWQLRLAPAVRMALHGYQAEFGGLPPRRPARTRGGIPGRRG